MSDPKGLKIRIPGHAGEVVERIGMQPVSIPSSELYAAYSAVRLLRWNGLGQTSQWRENGFPRITPYYYTDWHEPGAQLHVFVNKKKFDTLSEDLK